MDDLLKLLAVAVSSTAVLALAWELFGPRAVVVRTKARR